jgi:predicted N-acetyltransferase YhbS
MTVWSAPRPTGFTIVDLHQRPTAAPLLAAWLKGTFARNRPEASLEGYLERLQRPVEPVLGLPRTFVALVDRQPVGCARLVAADHADRPELTPWLASVFVTPAWRRRGIAGALVARVQAAARGAGFPTLYLYTPDQERLYARYGFTTIGSVIYPDDGRRSSLMAWPTDHSVTGPAVGEPSSTEGSRP